MGCSRARITHTEGMGRPEFCSRFVHASLRGLKSRVTTASGLFEPKNLALPQAHSWAARSFSSVKVAPGRPQAKACGHRFRFFFAIRSPKPPVSSSSMN
jgi:hypothetical protein